jgi:hypothetical protein
MQIARAFRPLAMLVSDQYCVAAKDNTHQNRGFQEDILFYL